MSSPKPITLVGATGLTGAYALRHLLLSPAALAITTLTRKAVSQPTPAQNPQTTFANREFADLNAAANETVGQPGGVFVSCLGTTRADAGGQAKQRLIDYDLNLALAKRAKADGVATYILVSSAGSSSSSHFFYPKMKGELEDAVKALDFDHTVILRPGALLGQRGDRAITQGVMNGLFGVLGKVGLSSGLAIEGEDVGIAIAHLAAEPPADKVTELSNSQLLQLANKYRPAA